MCTLGPKSLIFVSHQVLHLHTMQGGWVLPLCIYQIFFTKELEKYNARRLTTRYTPLQKSYFGCCVVDRHIWFRYAHRYAHPARLYVVSM